MGQILESLLRLQDVEKQLHTVRSRLRARRQAVDVQQRRVDQLNEQRDALREQAKRRRADADRFDLELKDRDQQVTKLRAVLNGAKSNKEYAAILTQINTIKADNARIEEQGLEVMQDVEALKTQADELQQGIDQAQAKLDEARQSSQAEIDKLEAMLAKLQARRAEATEGIDPETLALFDKLCESLDGEAMAPIDRQGRKQPYQYTCGGCYMTLNPEHFNALSSRDEVRQCDNCQRILYIEPGEG